MGEIVLRLPAGERRYWNDAEATARTWRDGWVYTGDLGRLDDDGFLYVVDRVKDVIIRGGYNVASVEVEAAIHELTEVAECGVVAVPHPILGQDVAAVVRWRAGAPDLSLDELRDRLADRLADYKLPSSPAHRVRTAAAQRVGQARQGGSGRHGRPLPASGGD